MDLSAELQSAVDLWNAGKWWALAAIVIGLLIRLLKSDIPLTPTLDPKYRAWAALGLGIAAGVVQAIASGTPMAKALMGGLGAAMAAITAHETIVEGVRKGRDFFGPPVVDPCEPPPPPSKLTGRKF